MQYNGNFSANISERIIDGEFKDISDRSKLLLLPLKNG